MPSTPADELSWDERATRYLKAELKRADLTYAELAVLMRDEEGSGPNRAAIGNKLSRGTFGAGFFIQALKAAGCRSIRLEDI